MIEVPLTRGKVAIIDDEDAALIAKYKWQAHGDSTGRLYAVSSYGSNGVFGKLRMHRLVSGAEKWQTVDHINGNTLDNRRCNLRICTHAENARNRTPSRHRASPKGVSLFKPNGKWRARITVDGHVRCLGYFETQQEAADAYDKAARLLFGQFAKTNSEAVTA